MACPLKPIHKNIIFIFEDSVSATGSFKEKTDWGFEIKEDQTYGGNEHRIAKIVSTGPECTIVKPGMTVIIEALMWSNQFDIDGTQHWQTDETKIVAVID